MSYIKQKILIVHNYYQISGGEDTVVANEKKMLEDNGHDVILYSRHNSELKELSRIQKLSIPFTTIFSIRTYREVKEIIELNKIDIVHVHNTLNLVSPSVYYAAFKCKVPVVQTIHNFRLLCPAATFYRDGHVCEECVKNGLFSAVKYNCYRGSKVQTLACVISLSIHRLLGTYKKLNYICLTEFNKEKLLKLKQVKEERVFVKANFVDIKDNIINYEKRDDKFVFVGRIDKLKGIDLLLKAWAKLKDNNLKLVIYGTGPLEDWCKKYVEDNKLSNVKIVGFVPNDEAKKIIANSKALILPTQWYEGFPMTIVKAFSLGTPVIGSDIGNVGNLIEEGVTGLKFKFDSVESLVDTVKNFHKHSWNISNFLLSVQNNEENYKSLIKIYLSAK